jgi:hypothetical protein
MKEVVEEEELSREEYQWWWEKKGEGLQSGSTRAMKVMNLVLLLDVFVLLVLKINSREVCEEGKVK